MFKNGISIIGAGNVAYHIAKAINNAGYNIIQIISRTRNAAEELANEINAEGIDDFQKIDLSVDLIIIAVNDDDIINVISKINFGDSLLVHTAGSVDMNIFEPYLINYGVFYPVQTFSKAREIDFSDIPICIEANNNSNQNLLLQFAEKICKNVSIINSSQRKKIHLAAVFANNFVNHMYHVSSNLLSDEGIPFDILKPLIKETAMKVMDNTPNKMQTGPALRNDNIIIKKHLEMLNNYKELQKIYRFVSENIKEINK